MTPKADASALKRDLHFLGVLIRFCWCVCIWPHLYLFVRISCIPKPGIQTGLVEGGDSLAPTIMAMPSSWGLWALMSFDMIIGLNFFGSRFKMKMIKKKRHLQKVNLSDRMDVTLASSLIGLQLTKGSPKSLVSSARAYGWCPKRPTPYGGGYGPADMDAWTISSAPPPSATLGSRRNQFTFWEWSDNFKSELTPLPLPSPSCVAEDIRPTTCPFLAT